MMWRQAKGITSCGCIIAALRVEGTVVVGVLCCVVLHCVALGCVVVGWAGGFCFCWHGLKECFKVWRAVDEAVVI